MTEDTEAMMRQYIQSVARTCAGCFRQRTATCLLCPAAEAKTVLERVDDIKRSEIPTRRHSARMTRRITAILTQILAPPVKSCDITAPGCTAKTKAKTLAAMTGDGLIETRQPAAGRNVYVITQKGIKYAALHRRQCGITQGEGNGE